MRFFKYLVPEYAAEFAARLHSHVDAKLQVHSSELPLVARWVGLQELYGKRVIPDSLCSLVNGAAGVLEHWAGAAGRSSGSAAGHSRQSLVTDLALELERRCLRTEGRPATTRFWLFEDCAQTLFRWKIMDFPVVDAL